MTLEQDDAPASCPWCGAPLPEADSSATACAECQASMDELDNHRRELDDKVARWVESLPERRARDRNIALVVKLGFLVIAGLVLLILEWIR